jgi:hypothetical protein
MRRIHFSKWPEDDTRKERDEYKRQADELRIASITLEEQVRAADRRGDYYKRKFEKLQQGYNDEKKELETRLLALRDQLTQSQTASSLAPPQTPQIVVDDSPRLLKRRRTTVFNDENKFEGGDQDTVEANVSHAYQPYTPLSMEDMSKGAQREVPGGTLKTPKQRIKHSSTPGGSAGKSPFRFAFRAPSTSLLALRGPTKQRDYSITAPRF